MLTRAEQMSKLREEGKNTTEIARLFGVSMRTVQRAISTCERKKDMNND